MKHALRVATLAASVSFVLAACGGKSSPDDAASDPQAAAAAEALDGQQALTGKLNAYIECYNRVDADLHRGAEQYTRWIKDPAAGPTGNEERVYGPNVLSDYDMKPCDAPLTEAAAAKPALPALDKAALAYQSALKTLAPISQQVHDYYDRQDHEDDQFAKGKQLHAPLMEALSAFNTASETFSDELEAQNDAAQREQLKALEQAEGRTREFYRLSMMLQAKEIVELMEDDSFDLAKASELLEGFNRISDEAHEKVAGQEPGKMDWSSFEGAAETFRREGKARLKRVTDKTPYSRIEQGWLDSPSLAPEGSPGKLMRTYNDLVFQSNRQ